MWDTCLDETTIINNYFRHIWEILNNPQSERNLSKVRLGNAYLKNAFLKNANLIKSDFSYANLQNADLRGANLSGADLEGANLLGVRIDSKTILDEKAKLVWQIVNHKP